LECRIDVLWLGSGAKICFLDKDSLLPPLFLGLKYEIILVFNYEKTEEKKTTTMLTGMTASNQRRARRRVSLKKIIITAF
jgi:hypothetical protein